MRMREKVVEWGREKDEWENKWERGRETGWGKKEEREKGNEK